MAAHDSTLNQAAQLAVDLSDRTDKERPTYRYPY